MKQAETCVRTEIPDRVLVVGLGKTGVALTKFLASQGTRVTVTDTKEETELSASLAALNGTPFEGHFGGHGRQDFLGHRLIVISPGVETELPALVEARERGNRVIGEVELASMYIKEPIIAVTGTNGKTTTTTLIGEIFKKGFGDVFVGGNIGNPLINYVLSGQKSRYVVAEISSFQLETIEGFRPNLALLLNITEDHLDRYPNFAAYERAKWAIFRNQTADDFAVVTRDLSPLYPLAARTFGFSLTDRLDEGAFLKGGELCVRLDGEEWLISRSLSPLVGVHNSENLLAALLTSRIYGVERQIVKEVIAQFRGLPHRVEFIRDLDSVRFYNDSKATNVDAARRALESMDRGVVLIAGGKDKGGSYEAIRSFADRIKSIVLIGEAAERIERELGDVIRCFREATLEDAVKQAYRVADRGETVLFSPMCSSFDMFRDYKDRGDRFRRIVEDL